MHAVPVTDGNMNKFELTSGTARLPLKLDDGKGAKGGGYREAEHHDPRRHHHAGIQVGKVKRMLDRSGNLQLSTYFRLLLLTTDGEEIVVDHAVVAVGLEPNTDLAKSSGLELDDKLGGFRHALMSHSKLAV